VGKKREGEKRKLREEGAKMGRDPGQDHCGRSKSDWTKNWDFFRRRVRGDGFQVETTAELKEGIHGGKGRKGKKRSFRLSKLRQFGELYLLRRKLTTIQEKVLREWWVTLEDQPKLNLIRHQGCGIATPLGGGMRDDEGQKETRSGVLNSIPKKKKERLR